MRIDKKYIIAPILILLGVFLAVASKVLVPPQLNNFWRIFMEIGGYAIIAVGCGIFGAPGKTKE